MLLCSIHLYIQTCSVFLLLLMLLLLKRTKNVIMLMTTKYFCLQCFIYSRNFDVCTCVYICRQQDINLVIISCSTCCLVGPVKATWVCASFDWIFLCVYFVSPKSVFLLIIKTNSARVQVAHVIL